MQKARVSGEWGVVRYHLRCADRQLMVHIQLLGEIVIVSHWIPTGSVGCRKGEMYKAVT